MSMFPAAPMAGMAPQFRVGVSNVSVLGVARLDFKGRHYTIRPTEVNPESNERDGLQRLVISIYLVGAPPYDRIVSAAKDGTLKHSVDAEKLKEMIQYTMSLDTYKTLPEAKRWHFSSVFHVAAMLAEESLRLAKDNASTVECEVEMVETVFGKGASIKSIIRGDVDNLSLSGRLQRGGAKLIIQLANFRLDIRIGRTEAEQDKKQPIRFWIEIDDDMHFLSGRNDLGGYWASILIQTLQKPRFKTLEALAVFTSSMMVGEEPVPGSYDLFFAFSQHRRASVRVMTASGAVVEATRWKTIPW